MAKKEGKISDALLKVALGYQVAEVTEEYAEVDGVMKLMKRKKTKKDVPPDLKAVQILLSTENDEEFGSWTDEELEREKERLMAALNGKKEEDEKTQDDGGRCEVKTKKPRPKPRKRVVKKKE